MSEVRIPANLKTIKINGLASLTSPQGKSDITAGDQLNRGDILEVAENTLIEFEDDNGKHFFYNSNDVDELKNLTNTDENQNVDDISAIIRSIELGLDPTQNEENATAAGQNLSSSGTHGFFTLSRSANETIATAGFDTSEYTSLNGSADQLTHEDAPLFDNPSIDISVESKTNDNTPTINGTTNLLPGTSVQLTITDANGIVQTINTIVQTGGNFTVDVPQALADGTFSVVALVSDNQGNTATSSTNGIVDTIAPGEGTGPNGTDELPLVEIPEASGGVGEDELTDGVEVLVTPPTGTEPGDTITVTVNQPDGSSTDVTTTVPDGWTGGTSVPVTVSPEDLGGENGELPDEGDYTITTTVTDSAGNTSSPSDPIDITVDTTAPGEGTGPNGTDELP
ncbi:retention module-containing protein, partial [Enterovibrio norvegicus]